MEKQLIILLCGCVLVAVIEAIVILKSKENGLFKSIIVIPLTADTENVEQLLRETIYNVFETSSIVYVVVCDYGASDELLSVCEKMMGNYRNFYISNPENVEKIIAKLL